MSDREQGGSMPIDRFAAILDAYGAEARRWPVAERAAAEALLTASAEAQALQDQAARLDRLLSTSPAPAPSSALRSAILQAAPRDRRIEPGGLSGLWQALLGTLGGELGGLRAAGAALGAALLLGVAAGGTVESRSGDATSSVAAVESLDIVQLALFDDSYAEY